jgi:hypothetical protein
MTRFVLLTYWRVIGLVLFVAGCAAPVTYDHPTKPLAEKQRDHIECLALANQAAMGAGGWSSDPALRNAIFTNARDQHYLTCLQSRGWTAADAAIPPPAPSSPKMDDYSFRQCVQVALSKLGLYHGPFKTDWTPEWQAVWQRYLDGHAELRNDQQQSAIRVVLDRDLATIQERLDWEACAS